MRISLVFFLLSSIFVAGGNGAVYLGCYKDPSVNARLMPDEKKVSKGTMTNKLCHDHCSSKGYQYAGTEWKFECFCSNDRPSYKARAEENECNSNCDGNQAEICGGGLRLSVYELQGAVENPVESQYVGCFVDNQSRVLTGGRKDTDILTPDLCVGYCYQQGFRLAGVQYGKECHCGDALVQRTEVNGQECSTPCAGDGRLQCGGTWRISVYHTGIPDLPHENNYLGCFQDNATGVRLLSAVKHVFKNNDVRLCMNVCFSQGYKYAGAEYGVECFCGNRKPAANVEVEENQCSMRCPKDKNSFCGGAWKISVYSTGFGTVQPYYPEHTSHGPMTRPPSRPPPRPTPRPPPRPNPRPPSRPPGKPTPKPSLRPTPQNPVRSNATNLSSEPVRATTPKCEKSVTQVNGKNMCKGQLIFREEFNRPLDENKWTRENKMPWSPDYEFVVFTENEQNLYIKNNLLHIKPTLLNESFVRNGKLQLTSCTGQRTEECSRQGMSYFILPPIESGRITTKESFSFKYGIINLRAKMPVGDWLRPELWLEPKRNAYGPGYSSGRVQLAMARGNINLSFGDYILGNNLLEAGVMIGTNDEIRGRAIEWNNPNGWHDDFHNYTLIWTPDNLSFTVDGGPQNKLIPNGGGTLHELIEFDNVDTNIWKNSTALAPIDKEFYLTLGLSAGGMRDFPDGCLSGANVKPWSNTAPKAMLNFWQARDKWLPTWNNEDSVLKIDSIKITAL